MNTGDERPKEDYSVYKRKLKIHDNCGLGRRLETVEDFKDSYFRDNYYNAFALTKKILERNEQLMRNRESEKTNHDKRVGLERLYNMITFCGGRGTGKTSVMDSVVNAIQYKSAKYEDFAAQYEKDNIKKEYVNKNSFCQRLNEYKFVCLDEIDASLLEDNEDILEVILSKMLHKLRQNMKNYSKNHLWEMEEGDTYSKGNIFRIFEDICRNKHNLLWRKEHPYEPGESSVEQLNDLAGSLDIREKLQKLIPIYLKALNPDYGKEKLYLVISIDDLDMHRNAYEMLEQIHRYLMIEQIIIFIAVSEKEIQEVCERHFKDIFDRSAELTMSYLEKVLPYSRRIYLPADVSGDFFNVVIDGNSKSEGLPVKHYLLGEIAQKTQVFYDGCGMETHFYEIGNLRTLFNLYYLLESMENKGSFNHWTEKDSFNEYRDTLNSNFEKLRNDVIDRMAAKKLIDSKQLRIFREYYIEDFSSNGQYLTEQIVKIINSDICTKENQVYGYSYGKLLGDLYTLSKSKQEFKPLVQCVLAMATIELTQNYMYAFYGKDENSRKKWDEFISGTICGNWGNEMLPLVKGEGKENHRIAYVKDYVMEGSVCIALDLEAGNQEQGSTDRYRICERWIDEFQLVQSFEMFMMFITKKSRAKTEENDIFIERNEEKKTVIKLSKWECTFDFLGFVVNSMDYEKFFDRTDHALLDVLVRYWSGSERELNMEQKKMMEQKIRDQSMREAYRGWYNAYRGMALPVYSLDIMYNILKRVKKKMEREIPKVIDYSEFLLVIKKFYSAVGACLKEEDEFYDVWNKKAGKEDYSYFYDAFWQSPFVYPFVNQMDNMQDKSHKLDIKQPLDALPYLFEPLFNGFIAELTKRQISAEETE